MNGRLGRVLAAIWIFGAAAYYYVRFTMAFIAGNRAAIDATLERLAGLIGWG